MQYQYCTFFYIPGFVLIPTSVNATLGSTATFNCSVTTSQPGWLVNGSQLTQLNTQEITTTSSAEKTYSLHVPATEEYNNTNVTCVLVILGGQNLYSDPVVLRIQGMFVSQILNLVSGPRSLARQARHTAFYFTFIRNKVVKFITNHSDT